MWLHSDHHCPNTVSVLYSAQHRTLERIYCIQRINASQGRPYRRDIWFSLIGIRKGYELKSSMTVLSKATLLPYKWKLWKVVVSHYIITDIIRCLCQKRLINLTENKGYTRLPILLEEFSFVWKLFIQKHEQLLLMCINASLLFSIEELYKEQIQTFYFALHWTKS